MSASEAGSTEHSHSACLVLEWWNIACALHNSRPSVSPTASAPDSPYFGWRCKEPFTELPVDVSSPCRSFWLSPVWRLRKGLAFVLLNRACTCTALQSSITSSSRTAAFKESLHCTRADFDDQACECSSATCWSFSGSALFQIQGDWWLSVKSWRRLAQEYLCWILSSTEHLTWMTMRCFRVHRRASQLYRLPVSLSKPLGPRNRSRFL
jgi:hypothetical protein